MSKKDFEFYQDLITSLAYDNYELKNERTKKKE
jgi:hypothetical protein